jgi:hypothetical protein
MGSKTIFGKNAKVYYLERIWAIFHRRDRALAQYYPRGTIQRRGLGFISAGALTAAL